MEKIIDQFGRVHDYLRISLTDKCNFRCTYCMPNEKMTFKPSAQLMSAKEIVKLTKDFVEMGIRKVRLTGGEPLARIDAGEIIRALGQLPIELTITSNGYLIDQFIDDFKAANISTINISLDTLKEHKFHQITRRNYFQKVIDNINLFIHEGFEVKVNSVLMKDFNENEIIDFAKWTIETPVNMRFIEYMPFNGNQWEYDKVVTYQQIRELIQSHYEVEEIKASLNDTAKNFRIAGARGSLGIISTVTNPFCEGCNRIRLTADGKLKNCLFSNQEVDILAPLRNGEDYYELIYRCFRQKHAERAGLKAFKVKSAKGDYEKNRSMINIGG